MTGQTTARGAGGNLRYTTITSNVADKAGQIVICFEEGMTWWEYINSKFVISVDGQLRIDATMSWVGVFAGPVYRVHYSDDSYAFITDVIREDETYHFEN